jgi:ankyrin repeat protein
MASSELTPYQILDVLDEAIDYVELRGIYRTKIHEHKQKKISAIKFRRICRAYETLSDYDKRKRYDSYKEWISELSLDKYTSQQLAAEPDLIRDLKKRLEKANLTDINAQDSVTGHTTLYCAARAGNVEAVKFLTDHGAEPDLMQRTKSTALHVAAFYGHADVVRCLLESGADYRIINSAGNTAEEEAFNDDVTRVFDELKQNAYVRVAADELDWFYENGLTQHQDTEYFAQRQTLLHCASKKGHFDMVRWLVEQRSANVDLVDFNGNSALHLAAYGGHRIIVDYLLENGCDSTLKNRWGTTAEEEGSKHGRRITGLFKKMRALDMFEMARKGANWWFYYYFDDKLKDMIDSNGISLLYYACRFGQYSVAKWLLEHGANINIQMTTKPRSTPLQGAKFRGHLSIVELLLEYGADVNIKNDFGTTVFNEDVSDEVDKDVASKIEEVLQQYKRNLKSEKLLDIHVYEDDGDGREPIVKIKLGLDAGYKELLAALSDISGNQYQYPYFSVARRALDFEEEYTTIISAVCRARYASSKFIDTPIHLIRHKTKPKKFKSQQSTSKESGSKLRYFDQQFSNQGTATVFSLKAPLTEKKNINVGDLMFTFSENCINDDIEFKVTTLFSPDVQTFGLPGCIYLFKTELFLDTPKLVELPVVSIANDPHARLYTLATPTSYWFTSKTRKTRQPMISGIHAFVHHADIIPGQLSLPADIFLEATLGQPLKSRDDPVPCTCLTLRKQDKSTFPYIAYHGTNIKVIQSILLDGLVIPGTVVSNGIRVSPPSNHFSRNETYFAVSNFADAIFLSPSIHYSSDPTYTTTFSDGDRQLIPVLECSVKSGSYETYPGTVENYTERPDDNITALEWRVKDPANIEINAVLFITKIDSIAASKYARLIRTTT